MFNILKKELIDIFRDKRTLLLSVLLPLVLMSALVFFYESLLSTDEEATYKVVVEEEQHQFVSELLANDETLEITAVKNVEKTLQAGEAVAGIILPEKFEQQVANDQVANVQILGDMYSQNSIIAMSSIQAVFMNYSQSIVANRLAENDVEQSVLTPFTIEQVQTVEGDNSMMMLAFLLPMMLSIAVGVGMSPAATDLIAGEKERRTMEALLMTPVSRSALLFAKWLTMTITATITAIITLTIVFVEIYFFTETLKAGLDFEVGLATIVLIALAVTTSYAALLASALMVTSIAAKTVKEAQSYSAPITMIAILPAMLMVNLGVNELTASHFYLPIVNLFAVFKELLFGIVSVEHIFMAIIVNLAGAAILFAAGRIMFMKDKWILS